MEPFDIFWGEILITFMGWLSQPVRYWRQLAVTLMFVVGVVLLFFALLIDQTTPSNRDRDPSFYTCAILGTVSFGSAVVILIIAIFRGFQLQNEISNVRKLNSSDAREYMEQLREMPEITTAESPLIGLNWKNANLNEADLSDFNLDRITLNAANLTGTCFMGASLRMAWLQAANLSGADFYHACLRSTRLEKANLSGADLRKADLQYARLKGADLREAALNKADLRAADLTGVLLRDASFNGATFDEFTTLPDGRKWTPGADLSVYGVASEHHRRPKLKRKRKPVTLYRSAIGDDYEPPEEPEPPAWVAREGRVLKVIAKRYPPASRRPQL